MKLRFPALWLVICTAVFVLLAAGCNDQLRQFIVPVPQPTGDPATPAHAITLSTNPAPAGSGSDFHINVSGDTSAAIIPVGMNPVFLGKNFGQVFAINSGDSSTPPTVSVYTALL